MPGNRHVPFLGEGAAATLLPLPDYLLAHLEPQQTIPSVTQSVWEGAEPRLRAVMEGLQQRANEGQVLPRSMGLLASGKAARAGVRRLQSPAYPHQEPLSRGNGG
jgi:hypothetical protein